MALESITRPWRITMNSESGFIALTDRVLEMIVASIESSDAEVDWELNDGVLTLDCASGGKVILNRHLASRELWVAANSGGFHFRAEGGAWRDTKAGTELGRALSQLLQGQAGVSVGFPALPAT